MDRTTERQRGRLTIGSALTTMLISAGLAACTSTSPTQDQMSRTTLETAPADLQLLCASEAAKTSGVESSKVLPTSSRKLDASNYQVELNAGGTALNCVVGADGKVVSVQPA